VVTLQRGPMLPASQEVAEPDSAAARWLGIALLTLPLLVLLPFPVPLPNDLP
jgi:hypothetical protein